MQAKVERKSPLFSSTPSPPSPPPPPLLCYLLSAATQNWCKSNVRVTDEWHDRFCGSRYVLKARSRSTVSLSFSWTRSQTIVQHYFILGLNSLELIALLPSFGTRITTGRLPRIYTTSLLRPSSTARLCSERAEWVENWPRPSFEIPIIKLAAVSDRLQQFCVQCY